MGDREQQNLEALAKIFENIASDHKKWFWKWIGLFGMTVVVMGLIFFLTGEYGFGIGMIILWTPMYFYMVKYERGMIHRSLSIAYELRELKEVE